MSDFRGHGRRQLPGIYLRDHAFLDAEVHD
jgi:hypothetical protein